MKNNKKASKKELINKKEYIKNSKENGVSRSWANKAYDLKKALREGKFD